MLEGRLERGEECEMENLRIIEQSLMHNCNGILSGENSKILPHRTTLINVEMRIHIFGSSHM